MVRQINVTSPRVYFKKFGSKNLEVNPDGSIKEYHEKWNDPVPKQPEPKESKPFELPPFIPYKHPPDYLVPIGLGLYTTPTNDPKVSDPQNCEGNLGDISPWCGKNPLSIAPIGLDIELAYDECNIWVEISPTLAFLKLPPGQIAYRFPGKCREEPPKPPPFESAPGEKRITVPNGIDGNAEVYAFTGIDTTSTTVSTYDERGTRKQIVDYFEQKTIFTYFVCPGIKQHHKIYTSDNSYYWYDSPIRGISSYQSMSITTGEPPISNAFTGTVDWTTIGNGFLIKYGVTDDLLIWEESSSGENNTQRRYYVPQPYPVITGVVELIIGKTGEGAGYIYKGKWKHILVIYNSMQAPTSYAEEGYSTSGSLHVHADLVVKTDCSKARDTSKLPPPPKRDKDCCMACCNSPSQDNTLLKEILAQIKKANKAIGSDKFPVQATIFDENEDKQEAQSKVIKLTDIAGSITKIIDRNEKISKIIGIDTFPLELPESIIVNPEKNIIQKALDFLNPFKNVKINSVMELLVWNIKQQSAVFGQWGQVIQVESTEVKEKNVDGKITKEEHTKTEEVVLPNMAQTMKEQILLQTQLMKNTGLTMDMIVKLMIELAQAKLIIAETVKRVEDIQQYMDYPTQERTVEVPLQINFPNVNDPQDKQNDLFELLKEGKAKIVFDDWTGEHSQDEKFLDLLQAAKTIMGVYYSKTD